MEVIDVLRIARENVPGHWHQGGYTDGDNNYCLVGHLAHAQGWEAGQYPVYQKDTSAAISVLSKVVKEQYPNDLSKDNIVVWNDEKGRTEEEILSIFDKAILAEEEYAAQK